MYVLYNNKISKKMMVVQPGEFYVGDKTSVISTILGSCISAVLFDPVKRIGGLNHFMLPRTNREKTPVLINGLYGVNAMELLINKMLKKGCGKKNLEAKVFGGSSVFIKKAADFIDVGRSNIDFIFSFLKIEKIPVVSSDVGGDFGRKIIFFSDEFSVFVKKIHGSILNNVAIEETKYYSKLKKKITTPGFSKIYSKEN